MSTTQAHDRGGIRPDVAEALRRLADEGYSVTGQRRDLVTLIASLDGRFTPEDLLREARGAKLNVARATLFRTLDILTRIGYLGRVADGGHLAYTVCGPGHHHHLVCSDCGQVVRVEDCPVEGLLSDLQSRTGYVIQDHRLDVAGICPACQRSRV